VSLTIGFELPQADKISSVLSSIVVKLGVSDDLIGFDLLGVIGFVGLDLLERSGEKHLALRVDALKIGFRDVTSVDEDSYGRRACEQDDNRADVQILFDWIHVPSYSRAILCHRRTGITITQPPTLIPIPPRSVTKMLGE
jgi:hypothetical protein